MAPTTKKGPSQNTTEETELQPTNPTTNSTIIDNPHQSSSSSSPPLPPQKTRLQTITIITLLTTTSLISVSGTGLLTTSLPAITTSISLSPSLIFWPASVYALTAGCTLLASGSIADVIGAKKLYILGSSASSPLILACGLAQTGTQFIVVRALLGVFVAMTLPTSMALVTASFPPGPRRNVAFAATGVGQPLGYAVGLVLGGVLTGTIGWRWGFYITGILAGFLAFGAWFVLPEDAEEKRVSRASWRRLVRDIDWVGVSILGAAFGLLSYVLAMVTEHYQNITKARNIALLVISASLFPAFSLWVKWQVKRGAPALIPNAVWKNPPFLFICISMFFTWAAFNAFQYTTTLFYQEVQHLSALQAAIRFIPMAVTGVLANVVAGTLVARVNVNMLMGISAVINAIAPILMAVASPKWTYWTAAFFAMSLSPVNSDVLWTVSSLVISRAFPADSQALAGGVFNTISQLGNSVGLAVTAAIAASVSEHDQSDSGARKLLEGYRAAYWTIFAGMVVVCVASFLGLRNVGKVGLKLD